MRYVIQATKPNSPIARYLGQFSNEPCLDARSAMPLDREFAIAERDRMAELNPGYVWRVLECRDGFRLENAILSGRELDI